MKTLREYIDILDEIADRPIQESNWTYEPPLTLNDVALMKKLRASVQYQNSRTATRPTFTTQERDRIKRILDTHPPGDARSYELLSTIIQGNTLPDSAKPQVDRMFQTYLTPPRWMSQQQQAQQPAQQPAQSGEPSAFEQGFMQGLSGGIGAPGRAGARPTPGAAGARPTPGAAPGAGTPPPPPMGQMPAKNMGPVQTAYPRLPMPRLR